MRALVSLALVALLLAPAPLSAGRRRGDDPLNAAAAFVSPRSTTATQGTTFSVDVIVNAGPSEIQAVEITIHYDPAVIAPVSVSPHPQFDDDSTLFGAPVFATGEIRRIVDLRHGTAATGSFAVASIQFQALAVGQGALGVLDAVLAAPDGTPLGFFPIGAADVTVVP